VYIDVNNVVYYGCEKDKKPKLYNFVILLSKLVNEYGFQKDKIHCICDPALRYKIDKRNEFEAFVQDELIYIAPKVADEFILSFAQKHQYCFIISNDKFRDYVPQISSRRWIEERRVTFMIMKEDICLSPNIHFNQIDLLPFDDDED